MSDELPDGWASAQVGELFSSHGGGTPNRGIAVYWNGNIPWLSSGDIKATSIFESSETITKRGLEESTARLCRRGSVLVVVRSGILKHTLPVAVLEREAAINQDIKGFDSGDDELNRWLALAWHASARNLLAENREGTTVQSVKLETLRNFVLPIPPLAEQRRIVARLETLLGKVNACQQRLAKIPALLKRFRQSVLAAACSGRLTADWRQQTNSPENIETIVEAIRRRREAESCSAVQIDRIAMIYARSEENDSSDLPEGWRFIALNKLCASFDYGTSARSQPSGKVPVLRMGNIQGGKLDWAALVYTSDDHEIHKYSLRPCTVLFNRTNSPELVGKTAIYRGERPAIFAGYLIRINQFPELDPEYLNICLNTNYAKEFCLRARTDGVNQSNINAQKLAAFEAPLCSLEEQKEIVRRVEVLFALADEIEARLSIARTHADQLTSSLLAKAFSGELVPNEVELARKEGRDFESADSLLERIRYDREAAQPGHPTARRQRPPR